MTDDLNWSANPVANPRTTRSMPPAPGRTQMIPQQQMPQQQLQQPRQPSPMQPSRQAPGQMPGQMPIAPLPELIPQQDLGIPPQSQMGPPPVTDRYYVPGYLRSIMGKTVRAEFIINNSYLDKVGVLVEVGVNYFVLHDVALQQHVMCDLYSVRFVTTLDVVSG